MADWLANAGIVSKSMNDTMYESDLRAEDIRARQQQARLRLQQERLGQMGLEDVTRARGVDEAVRRAGAGAAAEDARRQSGFPAAARQATAGAELGEGVEGPPEPLGGRLSGIEAQVPYGQIGVLEAMAKAAEQAGDPMKAMQIRQAQRKLVDEGAADIVRAVMQNDAVGKRPDLASVWNQKGTHAVLPDKTVLEVDPKSGDRVLSSVDAKTGAPISMFVGKTAMALGLVKKPETQVLKPGERLIEKGSGRNIAEVPSSDQFDIKDGILFNKGKGTWQQVGQGEWKLGNVTHGNMEVPVSINSKTGEIQQLGPGGVRTGLKADVKFSPDGQRIMVELPGGQISEFKPAVEAKPPSSGVLGFGAKPGVPGQPAILQPVNPPEQAPVQGAQKAPDGKWYVRHGNGWAEVVVGQPDRPGPQPAPAPAPKPAPAPAAAPKLVADAEPGPTLVEPASAAPEGRLAANQARRAERIGKVAEAVKGVAKKLSPDEAERAVSGFRQLVRQGTYTRASASIIEDAISSGKLSADEQRMAQTMLQTIKPQTAGR
jgi:hypothetical protein